MMVDSISFSIVEYLLPKVKTVLRFLKTGLDEKMLVFGLSSDPNKSSFSAISSSLQKNIKLNKLRDLKKNLN